MKKTIERTGEVLVYSDPDNKWLEVYFDRVRFPDGREGRYNRVVEHSGRGGVAVLPIRGTLIGLVLQFRYPVDREMWEIPRGFADGPDEVLEALRELREETGIDLDAGGLTDLGVIHPNSGVLATSVRLFAARCEGTRDDLTRGDGEATEIRWVSVPEILSLIARGEITDAFTLCAVLLAREKRLI
ncbi:MAG: NUDIX hydrolase [bacterium]|nr:NUDIX hydrolase [bacterium]